MIIKHNKSIYNFDNIISIWKSIDNKYIEIQFVWGGRTQINVWDESMVDLCIDQLYENIRRYKSININNLTNN